MQLLVIRHSHISHAEGRHADLSGLSSGVCVCWWGGQRVTEVGARNLSWVYLSDGPPWWATAAHCVPGGLVKLLLEITTPGRTQLFTARALSLDREHLKTGRGRTFADDWQGQDYCGKPVTYFWQLISEGPIVSLVFFLK